MVSIIKADGADELPVDDFKIVALVRVFDQCHHRNHFYPSLL